MRTCIGPYRIEGPLGRGGMGVVYRGTHDHLGRPVAIKALAPELTRQPEFRERFFSEAKTQALLQHPNIVGIYDLLADEGDYFIVMELVTGQHLDQRLAAAAGRPLDCGAALGIFSQVLSALDYAHSEGVIHRDVKPSNVMISPQGRVKLTDFGIALLIGDKRLTVSHSVIGTPTYMSPEQILHPRSVDHRTDIYSAAVVFFEMLAGRPPFDAETEYAIKKLHVEAAPPDLAELNPALPAGLTAAVAAALSKDPAARFPSAAAFLRALDESVSPFSPARAAPLPRPLQPFTSSRYTPPATAVEEPAAGPRPAGAAERSGAIAAGLRGLLQGRGLWIAAGAAALAAVIAAGAFLLILMRGNGGNERVVKATPPREAGSPALGATSQPPAPALPPGPAIAQPGGTAQSAPLSAPAPGALASAPLLGDQAEQARPVDQIAKPSERRARSQRKKVKTAPAAQPPPAAVQESGAEEAPVRSTAGGGVAVDRLNEMENVVVTLEQEAKHALDAYEQQERKSEVGPRLEEFVNAAVGLRKAFRKATGTGFGFRVLRDKLLKRGSREADQQDLEVKSRDLIHQGAEVDRLISRDPMGSAAMSFWRKVRHKLKQLSGFYR
ncbi:MAG TPA: serine/threonine-protein kinase [Thermoanaerobaculia bacterium]|nr:serine/threonine-protein kinase [Thermoanaerobaculia bacterium]